MGTIAAILLIAIGRVHAAEFAALIAWAVALVYGQVDGLDRRNAGDNGRSVEDVRGASLGSSVALLFLGTGYFVSTWPLSHDAPVVFSQSALDATIWIVLSMMWSIPQAYRVWRTSPQGTRN